MPLVYAEPGMVDVIRVTLEGESDHLSEIGLGRCFLEKSGWPF